MAATCHADDDHELAKQAKDLGSAAVFVSLVNCAVVWGQVLYDIFGFSSGLNTAPARRDCHR